MWRYNYLCILHLFCLQTLVALWSHCIFCKFLFFKFNSCMLLFYFIFVYSCTISITNKGLIPSAVQEHLVKLDRMIGADYSVLYILRSATATTLAINANGAAPCYRCFFDRLTAGQQSTQSDGAADGASWPTVKAISTVSDPPASSGYCFPFRRRRRTISKNCIATIDAVDAASGDVWPGFRPQLQMWQQVSYLARSVPLISNQFAVVRSATIQWYNTRGQLSVIEITTTLSPLR